MSARLLPDGVIQSHERVRGHSVASTGLMAGRIAGLARGDPFANGPRDGGRRWPPQAEPMAPGMMLSQSSTSASAHERQPSPSHSSNMRTARLAVLPQHARLKVHGNPAAILAGPHTKLTTSEPLQLQTSGRSHSSRHRLARDTHCSLQNLNAESIWRRATAAEACPLTCALCR